MFKKLLFLLTNILFFSVIYFLLDDAHFSGINVIEETLRDEILRKNLTFQMKENFEINVDVLKDKDKRLVAKETREIKNRVKDEDFEKLEPGRLQQLFDRFYFSAVSGTTLGYGDIFPRTNTCRVITLLQLFVTVSIVFF